MDKLKVLIASGNEYLSIFTPFNLLFLHVAMKSQK